MIRRGRLGDVAQGAAASDPAAFVGERTRLTTSPHVPEIRLHLTPDVFGLWEAAPREAGHDEPPLPFWAVAWVGGLALARYVLDHPEVVAGRRVWDLASGSGLVAIAAARAGAAHVIASDVDPCAIAAIRLNAATNGVAVTTSQQDALDGAGGGADVVLAGDVCYDAGIARRALAFLDRARARGAGVLVGDPGRAHLPRRRFVPLATYDVPGTGTVERADVTSATVWQPRD